MDKEQLVDRAHFIELLNERFPSVYADITDLESGLLHMEMGVLSQATRLAIEEERWKDVAEHYDFIAKVFSRANADVNNAVYVSYLENVLLGEESSKFSQARRMLPDTLKCALVELEKHFDMLAKQAEVNRERRK
jgi:hypothetical protein